MSKRWKPVPVETEKALREVLCYDPASGLFVWLKTVHSHATMYTFAGTINKKGYRVIQFHKIMFRANRLAIWFTTGKWPESVVDHIDGNKSNDRLKNLRDVTQSINMQNQCKPHKRNKSGYIGVSIQNGKYIAQINYKDFGGVKYLGSYDTPEEAHGVYLATKIDYEIELKRRQHNATH